MREERIGCNNNRSERRFRDIPRHSETSHRARLSINKVGAMRYNADYVEGAGSNRSGDRNKNKAGNMRIGHRNNKAGNVKATGKEQDSGHFTKRSARSLRSLRSRPRY